ncbi:MAG: transposase [bacterium]|nr:transposase [bacterium]
MHGDAGFQGVDFLDQLDERDVRYTFRIPTNKNLQQWEEILAVREPGHPRAIPRTWTHNVTYQAATWEKPRRVVVVVQERPGELYLHTFFILTSFTKNKMSADETVDFYCERALMENHIGEHQSVLNANLASNNRPKTNIKQKPIKNADELIDVLGQTGRRNCCTELPTNPLRARGLSMGITIRLSDNPNSCSPCGHVLMNNPG